MLRSAVLNHLNNEHDDPLLVLLEQHQQVPAQTLKDAIVKFKTAAALHDIPLDNVTREHVYSNPNTKCLLDTEQLGTLNAMILERDQSNNGMSRAEAITVIQELTQTFDRKRCENHFDYLVKNKRLPGLKRRVGRVDTLQKTRTSKSLVEQQTRRHTTMDMREEDISSDELISEGQQLIDVFGSRPLLLKVYKSNRSDRWLQERVYKHVCNSVAQSNWDEEKDVSPSPYLDAHMTIQQKKLLNPTHKQLLTGFVLHDGKGQGAKQKVAKRRLDMIEANIAMYSRILNDAKR